MLALGTNSILFPDLLELTLTDLLELVPTDLDFVSTNCGKIRKDPPPPFGLIQNPNLSIWS